MSIETGVVTLLSIVIESITGDGHDQLTGQAMAADFATSLITVQAGQTNIQQNDFRPLLHGEVHAFASVVSEQHFKTHRLEQDAQAASRITVVIDNEQFPIVPWGIRELRRRRL